MSIALVHVEQLSTFQVLLRPFFIPSAKALEAKSLRLFFLQGLLRLPACNPACGVLLEEGKRNAPRYGSVWSFSQGCCFGSLLIQQTGRKSASQDKPSPDLHSSAEGLDVSRKYHIEILCIKTYWYDFQQIHRFKNNSVSTSTRDNKVSRALKFCSDLHF